MGGSNASRSEHNANLLSRTKKDLEDVENQLLAIDLSLQL